jgi:hypothetical protein
MLRCSDLGFERAVVAHKFLMEFVEEVRRPIGIIEPALWFLGHVHLHIKNDSELSAHNAKESCSEQLSARSVIAAIADIRNELFAAFTNTDELMEKEMNEESLMKFTAELLPVSGKEGDEEVLNKVTVKTDGYSEIYCGNEMDFDKLSDELVESGLQ